jgi:hypothetical protein
MDQWNSASARRFRKDTLARIDAEVIDVLSALENALPLFFNTMTRQTLHFLVKQIRLAGPAFAQSMLIVECFNVFFKANPYKQLYRNC